MKDTITILLLITVLGLNTTLSQSKSIEGKVTDKNQEGIPGVTIVIKGTALGTVTDMNGQFELQNNQKGSFTLLFSGVGYENQEKQINSSSSVRNLSITLKESTTELNAVQVLGKSLASDIREQAYAVEVLESKGFKNLTTNANDILGKISGVNIRQSGGLGSQFSVSLNGLSGNQLRIFLDGVPMDYFGSSLSLNNFSANLIERIEVYKGVVPIHLSSDALGGAINVVTSQKTDSYLDASYSVGSFNTHVGSLNGQYRNPNSGLTVRIKSFVNTTQNNYEVPVNLVNFETGKEDKTPTWVERFHDSYNSKMAWVETGFLSTPFADQLMFGVMYSENHKELQQPANAIGQAKIPYGEVAFEEEKLIANFSYNKSGLLNKKLNIRSYLVGVFSNNISVDTSSYQYDWFGNRKLKTNGSTGEIENRKTWFTREIDNYLANVNAEYEISKNHNVAFNYSLNKMQVQGKDPFKAENNTQFSNPSTVGKQVFGGSYTQSLINNRMKNCVFTKMYSYRVSSLETDYGGDELLPFDATKTRFGFGFSSTFQLKKLQFKASYENATRLPELIELFGDGLNYQSNPVLLPEQSNNYNMGIIYNTLKPNPLMISANGFVRDAENFILPQVVGITVHHINNGLVLAKGVDLASSYTLHDKFVFSFNGTFLDKRDNNRWRNGAVGVASSQYKIRIPNEPYLFGNFTASYRKKSLFIDSDYFSTSIAQNYVHEFFYRWENLASKDKGIVPDQWTTNLDFVYSLKDEMYNFSFGIANLWDAKVYDNFYQLRPGRTFNFKIRYFIK
jgi:outer membrane cobalamin receptor